MMAIMFPEFKKSKLWWGDGVDRLEKELKRQICEDGVSGETSTNYHFFVLDSFLQIWILLNKNGYQYPSETNQMLEKMIEFSMYICRPDGTLPIVGDSDSGRGIRLDDLNGDDRRSYLSTGAALFDRPDMKSVAGKFYEESLWLLGVEGYKKFEQLSSRKPKNLSILYPDSGFCIMRSDWTAKASQLIFRGGVINIPKDVSIGHNHADYLSFELVIDGKPFIIDPGVHTYHLEDERWYSRKTSSHNTVVVDNKDQFVVDMQRFGLPRIAKSQVHTFKHTDSIDVVDISHDGYSNQGTGVSHRRKISFDCAGRLWVINDILTGNGKHQFDWYFHFDNEIDCDIIDGLCILAKDKEGTRLELRPLDTNNLWLEMNEGWISKKYGEKRKAIVARYFAIRDCPTSLTFQILGN